MAKTKTITIECPKCREAFEIKGYETINASLDEALKEKLIKTELFKHTCPECGETFSEPYSLKYQDMEKEYMVILDMGDIDTAAMAEEVLEMFPNYRIRIVKDVMDLLEKIHIFESNLNDKIITYLDHKIYEDVSAKLKAENSPIAIDKVLFGSFEFQKKKVVFGALNNAGKQIFIDTPFADYKALANSPRLAPCFKEKEGEYASDKAWAEALA